MKKLTLLLACFFISMGLAIAQNKQVTGSVIDEEGEPVIGASVVAKGNTTVGTVTDVNGIFTLNLPPNANTLVVSYLGMIPQEVIAEDNLKVTLKISATSLGEVVVTALGLTKEEKALGYAVQSVSAKGLTQAANSSLAGALQGKTSGVEIKPSSGMPGASSQIIIRGARSFTENNTPLYVVDGMPIISTPDMSTGDGVTGTDFANRAIDIDPNDIETINILKGQAASALYGINASNGVIVITTKSGKGLAQGKPHITISSSISFDKINRYPELQKTYAQGSGGRYNPTSSSSWGPKISELPNDPTYGGNVANARNNGDTGTYQGKYYVPQRANAGLDPWVTPATYDNIKDYFDTGSSWTNYVNIAQALAKSSYSLSLGSTSQDGIVPTTGMTRYNAKFMAETEFNKHWKSGVTATYVNTSINKMPTANDGLMATIYPAPPSYDLAGIPQHYEGNPYAVNNYRGGSFPAAYWALDNIEFTEKTSRFYGNAFINYFSDLGTSNQKLNVKYQIGTDSYSTDFRDLWGYGIKGSSNNGQVESHGVTSVTFNSLFLANYDWDFNEDWKFNGLLGNEIIQDNAHDYYMYGANFQIPGWNHILNASSFDSDETLSRPRRTVGFYGSLSASFRNMLYLNVTGREDYVSSMPPKNHAFFYPSASLGFILTELDALKNNSIVNFAKIRASIAEVGQAGNYIDNYYSKPAYGSGFYTFTPILYPINGVNAYTPYYTVYDPNLKPQNTRSYELGFDLKFLNNLFTLDYTFSRQNVKDQIFSIPLAGSSGASYKVSNGGSIHTNAHEITLGINPIRTKDIDWNIAFNWSKIDNYVDALAPEVESIFLGGFVTPQVRAGIGDKFPVIYGTSYARDDKGNMIVDEDGIPLAGDAKVIGKVSPDFILGATTNLRLYKFTLGLVFDWKSGGQMYGGTNGLLDYYGISKNTESREGSFIVKGVKEDGSVNDIQISGASDQQYYYAAINSIDESSIYDNSFVKLREVSLGYQAWKTSKLEVNINGFVRNILLWTNYPNFDPESNQGNTSMAGAFERFSLPQTSSFGLGLNVKF